MGPPAGGVWESSVDVQQAGRAVGVSAGQACVGPHPGLNMSADAFDRELTRVYYMINSYMEQPAERTRHSAANGPTWCAAAPGRMPGFVQPWILLLLAQAPSHGYQLLERLRGHPDTEGIDPGFLYRTLRQLEEEGHVKSAWDIETHGPARRVYELTSDGFEHLHSWIEHVRGARQRLGNLIQAYEALDVREK